MIELADLIEQLRRELTTAVSAGADEELRFELGPVELEAAVVVERAATAGAKVRFWVLDAGGEARAGSSETHRIKLTLDPRIRSSGGRPWVSGDTEDGER
ncbi:MAG: hypothetical protein FWE15_19490 [Actinomycetia bacterium]|nr:hypothetical protein [Actinomycetes bacterium]MCL2732198.1 hypothetical protein [Actinomycetes bacterium]